MGAAEALEALRAVTPVRYHYKPGMGPKGERWGAIAEDVPERFTTPARDTLDMLNILGALVAAVRGLAERVKVLEQNQTSVQAEAA